MTVGTAPNGLFGQMLLVDREATARGGHEAVQGRILENFFLAGQFPRRRSPDSQRDGTGSVCVPNVSERAARIDRGLEKRIAAGAGQTRVAC